MPTFQNCSARELKLQFELSLIVSGDNMLNNVPNVLFKEKKAILCMGCNANALVVSGFTFGKQYG